MIPHQNQEISEKSKDLRQGLHMQFEVPTPSSSGSYSVWLAGQSRTCIVSHSKGLKHLLEDMS